MMPPRCQETFDEVYSDCFAFSWPRSDGAIAELKPGGADTPLTYATRAEWCELLLRSRCCDECASQTQAVRRGLAQLVPVNGLALFTVDEVERLVCGEARRRKRGGGGGHTHCLVPTCYLCVASAQVDWKVSALKAKALVSVRATLANWLWEVLQELTAEERGFFLQFVWGRSRMPSTIVGQMKVCSASRDGGMVPESALAAMAVRIGVPRVEAVDTLLPTAATCSFQIAIPAYTCKEALADRLRFAIYNCRSLELA
jgi:E3 ubiquitin-protein ligase HERC1